MSTASSSGNQGAANSSSQIPTGISIISLTISALSLAIAFAAILSNQETAQNTLHSQFRESLATLARIERDGSRPFTSSDGGCGGCGDEGSNGNSSGCDESCLGNLSLQKSYRDQYQLITAEAVALAAKVSTKISDAEMLQLCHALYVSGDLVNSTTFANELSKREPAFALRFRQLLLQAQIAFFQRQLDEGYNRIHDALRLIENQTDLSNIERTLLGIEAKLICANMHIALGEKKEGRGCLIELFNDFKKLPNTNLVSQLRRTMEDQVTEFRSVSDKEETFKEFEERLDTPLESAPAAPAAPAPAAPAAPSA